MAGGLSNSRLELATLVPLPAQHHLASLITHGVFERFPGSRVLFVEHGFTWLPSVLWNLDGRYEVLRRESPWVKRLPSDYVREHVRFSTQPFDMTKDRKQLIGLLESYEGMEDLLCFASDYPHWDADEPSYLASRLPKAWLPKVFYENAAQFFGLEHRAPATVTG
jgi:predicted TIM-barrel fold metal-dependent hydrolase